MAGPLIDNTPKTTSATQVPAVDGLSSSFATVTVYDEAGPEPALQNHEKDNTTFCSIRIYTRRQLLLLHNSSLVQLPPNMPVLKDWFGYDAALVLIPI